MDQQSYAHHVAAVVQAGTSPPQASHVSQGLMSPVVTQQNGVSVPPPVASTHSSPLITAPSTTTNPAYEVYASTQATDMPVGTSSVAYSQGTNGQTNDTQTNGTSNGGSNGNPQRMAAHYWTDMAQGRPGNTFTMYNQTTHHHHHHGMGHVNGEAANGNGNGMASSQDVRRTVSSATNIQTGSGKEWDDGVGAGPVSLVKTSEAATALECARDQNTYGPADLAGSCAESVKGRQLIVAANAVQCDGKDANDNCGKVDTKNDKRPASASIHVNKNDGAEKNIIKSNGVLNGVLNGSTKRSPWNKKRTRPEHGEQPSKVITTVAPDDDHRKHEGSAPGNDKLKVIIPPSGNKVTGKGRPENGRTDVGRKENGRKENGRTENGRSENGRSENGRTENGRTEKARKENGRTDHVRKENGRTENSRTENGRPEKGRKEHVRAENGRTENGRTDKRHVDGNVNGMVEVRSHARYSSKRSRNGLGESTEARENAKWDGMYIKAGKRGVPGIMNHNGRDENENTVRDITPPTDGDGNESPESGRPASGTGSNGRGEHRNSGVNGDGNGEGNGNGNRTLFESKRKDDGKSKRRRNYESVDPPSPMGNGVKRDGDGSDESRRKRLRWEGMNGHSANGITESGNGKVPAIPLGKVSSGVGAGSSNAMVGSGGSGTGGSNGGGPSGSGEASPSACYKTRGKRYDALVSNCVSVGCAQWNTDKMFRVTVAVGAKALLALAGVGSTGRIVCEGNQEALIDDVLDMRKHYGNAMKGQRDEWIASKGKKRFLLVLAPFRKRNGVDICGVSGIVIELQSPLQ